jgi:Bacterial toxin 50
VKPGTKLGDEGFKEVVDFRERVGFYYDNSTGNYIETNYGQIVYSKKGTHIIPANPVQKKLI